MNTINNPTDCEHNNVVVETTGTIAMIGGEIIDTQAEHLFCIDCMSNITSPVMLEKIDIEHEPTSEELEQYQIDYYNRNIDW